MRGVPLLLTIASACAAATPKGEVNLPPSPEVADAGAAETGATRAPDAHLELHPGEGGPCSHDDECMVTNASPDCCACCGTPPRPVRKDDFDAERGYCATAKMKCIDCSRTFCKPTESADGYRAVCVGKVCRAARR